MSERVWRYLAPGGVALVPKYAVVFDPESP